MFFASMLVIFVLTFTQRQPSAYTSKILIMHNKLPELDTILKEVCVRYFCAMIIASSFFAVYYWYEDIKPLNIIVGACPIVHILLFVIPYKLNYQALKPLISVYLIYVSVFLFLQIIFFWSFGQITVFMWYSIIPIAAMIFFKRKTVIFWSIYVLVLICLGFIVVPFMPERYYQKPTDNQLMVINIMTIVLNISFVMLFIYYHNKISLIKELQLRQSEELLENKGEEEIETKEVEIEKFESLYNEILTYFSEKKPYCNPDFTIVQLAEDLDSNVKYISRVIKLKENVNFSVFLNMYRISLVKELIADNYHNKYTIGYIYTTAGFRHQSTFNKVFKEIEGVTPSEYIKSSRIRNDKAKE